MRTSYRNYWLPDLLIIGVLFVVTVIVGAFTNLDVELASSFYVPVEQGTSWPQREAPLWKFFYHAIPWFTGGLAAAALAMLIRGTMRPEKRRLRLYGLFIFMSVIFGPGIVVNAVFKDHWGRPRPRHTIQFGGNVEHRPFYLPGERGKGKSFPCGHSSVGFAFIVLAFLFRRKRPLLAAGIAAACFVFGMLVGIGRMAAGAHYFSDVLMSAVMPWFVAWLVYYFVLRIPEREDAPDGESRPLKHPKLVLAAYAGLGVLLLFMLLLATPVHERIRWKIPVAEVAAPMVLELSLDYGQMHVHLLDKADLALEISGEALGFGLPTNTVQRAREINGASYRCDVTHSGIFTERDTKMRVDILRSRFGGLKATAATGDIRVTGATKEECAMMQLHAPNGTVHKPE